MMRQTVESTDLEFAANHPARLVDLQRYPIHDLARPTTRALVSTCRSALRASGACILPAFLTTDALQRMVSEARAIARWAHWGGSSSGTAYLEPPDMAFPENHPRRRTQVSSVGAIAYDLIPVMKDGDSLLWHYDQTDFVTSILLQDCQAGGDFEYVPMIRTAGNENYDRVRRLLDGDRGEAVRLALRPGTFAFFEGRQSIHRVAPIAGPTDRYIGLLGFDTKPDTNSSERLKMRRYGRVA
jgi:hypothetical protein